MLGHFTVDIGAFERVREWSDGVTFFNVDSYYLNESKSSDPADYEPRQFYFSIVVMNYSLLDLLVCYDRQEILEK